jgi:hypothetical protein
MIILYNFFRETAYVVTFSASKWPSGTARVMECNSGDDLCLERYRKNAAMVQVFYEELNYETMAESPSYTVCHCLNTVLSNIVLHFSLSVHLLTLAVSPVYGLAHL